MAYLSTVGRIFDRDVILTYFTYFSGCPPLFLTDIRDAKGANICNPWLESACVGVSYIKDSGTKDASTKDVCTVGACSKDACIRGNCIGGTCDIGHYISGASIGSICNSVDKLSKSSVWYLRLLVKSISQILVSFCLHYE